MTKTRRPVPDDGLAEDAFAVVRPRYGDGSLADLLPSVSAVLGVPGAADVLGLRARLDGVNRVAVLLVDGLGAYQMPLVRGLAPVLADLAGPAPAGPFGMSAGSVLTSGFPSTTPVSLVTLGAGVPPGAHGVLGFTVRRPDGRILNHIHWGDDPDPRTWQPVPTRWALAAAAGVAVTIVTRPEFAGTGLTMAASGGGVLRGATEPDTIAAEMLRALADGTGPALVYGYYRELDRHGHGAGVGSPGWCDAARDVDGLLDRLVTGLPAGGALLVTADHGQLNVPYADRFDLGTHPALSEGVTAVAGEPRVRYLYPAPGALEDVAAAYRSVLGAGAEVLTREQAIDDGWFGPVPDGHRDRIGELVVLCRGRAVLLASGWEPPSVASLIAFHGSAGAAEMTVPLLVVRR